MDRIWQWAWDRHGSRYLLAFSVHRLSVPVPHLRPRVVRCRSPREIRSVRRGSGHHRCCCRRADVSAASSGSQTFPIDRAVGGGGRSRSRDGSRGDLHLGSGDDHSCGRLHRGVGRGSARRGRCDRRSDRRAPSAVRSPWCRTRHRGAADLYSQLCRSGITPREGRDRRCRRNRRRSSPFTPDLREVVERVGARRRFRVHDGGRLAGSGVRSRRRNARALLRRSRQR